MILLGVTGTGTVVLAIMFVLAWVTYVTKLLRTSESMAGDATSSSLLPWFIYALVAIFCSAVISAGYDKLGQLSRK